MICVCGHGQEAHQHYRPGTDCSLCPCPKWRPNGYRNGPKSAQECLICSDI